MKKKKSPYCEKHAAIKLIMEVYVERYTNEGKQPTEAQIKEVFELAYKTVEASRKDKFTMDEVMDVVFDVYEVVLGWDEEE